MRRSNRARRQRPRQEKRIRPTFMRVDLPAVLAARGMDLGRPARRRGAAEHLQRPEALADAMHGRYGQSGVTVRRLVPCDAGQARRGYAHARGGHRLAANFAQLYKLGLRRAAFPRAIGRGSGRGRVRQGLREQGEDVIRHVMTNTPRHHGLLEGAKGVQPAYCAMRRWAERRRIDVPPPSPIARAKAA